MNLGLVVGTVTATRKHASMEGAKLLVVQMLMTDEKTPDGDPVLAVDELGAGRGERVMITSDGAYTRKILGSDATPVRWSVIGISNT